MTGNELSDFLRKLNFQPSDMAVRSGLDAEEIEQWANVGETPVPEWIAEEAEFLQSLMD